MSDQIIRKLYETRINAWADLRGYKVAYENVTFTPPQLNPLFLDDVYLRVFILKAPSTGLFLDRSGRTRRGVLQIDVVGQKGIGAGPLETIVASLEDLFPEGLRITDTGGLEVITTSPLSAGTGITGDSDYAIPLSCSYRADTT